MRLFFIVHFTGVYINFNKLNGEGVAKVNHQLSLSYVLFKEKSPKSKLDKNQLVSQYTLLLEGR